MPPGVLATIVKIALASLAVGIALSIFGVDPRNLLSSLGSTAVEIYEIVLSFLRWALRYVLIGAIVVVPIWLVFFLLRIARGR